MLFLRIFYFVGNVSNRQSPSCRRLCLRHRLSALCQHFAFPLSFALRKVDGFVWFVSPSWPTTQPLDARPPPASCWLRESSIVPLCWSYFAWNYAKHRTARRNKIKKNIKFVNKKERNTKQIEWRNCQMRFNVMLKWLCVSGGAKPLPGVEWILIINFVWPPRKVAGGTAAATAAAHMQFSRIYCCVKLLQFGTECPTK